MALTKFKKHFANSYQDTFNKVLVAEKVASTSYQKILKYGESIERPIIDFSGVIVRDVVSSQTKVTIDDLTDSSELMTVNISKDANFFVHDDDISKLGPLNVMEKAGTEIAIKLATDFDARIFGEVINAENTFDTGDLTSLVSTGVPITLSSTTVPQMVARMGAKIKRENVMLNNLVMVIDADAAAYMTEYLMGKDIDLAGSVFSNGYEGMVMKARVYTSENLSSTTVLGMATNPTDADIITYNGATVTFLDALTGAESEIHITATVDATRANLSTWLTAGGTTSEAEALNAGYSAATAADQIILTNLTSTDDAAADTLSIFSLGKGAIVVDATLTAGGDAWGVNYIHAYYGVKGGIDAALQQDVKTSVKDVDDNHGKNVLTKYLGSVKTFADGAKKFVDLQLAK